MVSKCSLGKENIIKKMCSVFLLFEIDECRQNTQKIDFYFFDLVLLPYVFLFLSKSLRMCYYRSCILVYKFLKSY